jgi:hypothetical protein
MAKTDRSIGSIRLIRLRTAIVVASAGPAVTLDAETGKFTERTSSVCTKAHADKAAVAEQVNKPLIANLSPFPKPQTIN